MLGIVCENLCLNDIYIDDVFMKVLEIVEFDVWLLLLFCGFDMVMIDYLLFLGGEV